MTARFAARIALVAHGFHPQIGGMERFAEITAEALGPSVPIRVFAPELPGDSSTELETRSLPANFEVRRLPCRKVLGERVIRPLTLIREIQSFRPDLLWTHHPGGSADIAALHAQLVGLPWIATYHADPLRGSVQRPLIIGAEAVLLRSADRVIVTSDYYSEKLQSRGVGAGHLTTVTPGPLIGGGTPPGQSQTLPQPMPRPGSDHPFLFVGRIDDSHEYKRLEMLIAVVGGLRSRGVTPRLLVVGGGNRLSAMRELSVSFGVEASIEFTGTVDDASLAGLFRRAWALVLPSDSDSEGFGAVCIDAIQYGCPVVGSRSVPGVALLERHGAGIAYDGGSPTGLAEAMEALWSSPDQRNRLSEAAWDASRKFGWDESFSSVRQLVDAVLKRHAPG